MAPLGNKQRREENGEKLGAEKKKKTQQELPGNCKIISSLRFHINTGKHSTHTRGKSLASWM